MDQDVILYSEEGRQPLVDLPKLKSAYQVGRRYDILGRWVSRLQLDSITL